MDPALKDVSGAWPAAPSQPAQHANGQAVHGRAASPCAGAAAATAASPRRGRRVDVTGRAAPAKGRGVQWQSAGQLSCKRRLPARLLLHKEMRAVAGASPCLPCWRGTDCESVPQRLKELEMLWWTALCCLLEE